MTRYRVFLILLLLVWPAGCGEPHGRGAAPLRQRPDRDGDRCRGELILVRGSAADRPSRTVSPAAIEAARQFTVAIRGRRSAYLPGADDGHVLASESAQAAPVHLCIEGSGVVIDRAGLILTNHHVVRDASELEVWVRGGGWLPARLVGADAYGDLAVISVDAQLCCAARLADADALRISQAVAALGHAPGDDVGAGPDALRGSLEGLHRSLQSALDPMHNRYYGDLLEATVPLEPGHSGGALIDRRGAVVGISTAAVTNRRTGRRTGYAIPMSAYVRSVIDRLARGRPVVHGYLGVLVCACSGDHEGVQIERLIPGGPADRAGLAVGDTIVRLASTPVRDAAHFSELVRSGTIGQPMPIQIQRDDRTVELTCVVQQHPSCHQ
ncbi:MAG TPA: trypsin-like peptidase domain-containing protein [Phycisphaerae bacterium]|nr:trypsin-like peptidase domain-containing protein [Phycisphaerae bacterium]